MKIRALLILCLSLILALAFVGCPAPEQPDGPTGPQGVTYTVSYYYDENRDGLATGEPDEIDTVPENNRAVMLSLAPTVMHELEGWYRVNPDGTTGEKWDINNPVTENIALVANWRLRDYHVHYYVGALELWRDTIPYGYMTDDPYLAFPEQCERVDEWKTQLDAGKVFLGWHTAEGVLWDFENSAITQDVELYALFGDPS